MPPNYKPAMHRVEQALKDAPKGIETIILGDLNVRLRDPCDGREEDLEMVLADCGLVNMTDHSLPRRRYMGDGRWMWRIWQEGRHMMGRGDYVLSMY